MKISKSELKELYYSQTNKEVCSRLGISHPTLVVLLRENNIILKGKGFKGLEGSTRKVLVTDDR